MSVLQKRKPDRRYRYIPISILAVGLIVRFSYILYDSYGVSFDDYALMIGVEKGFTDYISHNQAILAQTIPYWLSYRISGYNMVGYMGVPVLLSMMTFLVIYKNVQRYWHSALVSSIVLLLLVYNNYFLHLTKYPMVSSIASLFVTSYLYFFFLKILTGKAPLQYRWALPAFFLMAFFSIVTVVIPIFCGIVSLGIVHVYIIKKDFRQLKQLFKQVIPLVIFPLTYGVVYAVHPFTNLGADKRPDMWAYFFETSNNTPDVFGIVKYLFINSSLLFHGLFSLPFRESLVHYFPEGILILFLLSVTVIVWETKKDVAVVFTIIYIATIWQVMFFGGLVNQFPFGDARYAQFLLVPIVLVVAYGLNRLVMVNDMQKQVEKIFNMPTARLVFFTVCTIVSIGTVVDVLLLRQVLAGRTANRTALRSIFRHNREHLFYTNFIAPVIHIKAPMVYDAGHLIGWGIFHGLQIDTTDPEKYIHSDLFVLVSEASMSFDTFPKWKEFVTTNYNLKERTLSPAFQIFVYERK